MQLQYLIVLCYLVVMEVVILYEERLLKMQLQYLIVLCYLVVMEVVILYEAYDCERV